MKRKDSERAQFWGLGADDWTNIQEPLHLPLYEALLDVLALQPGATLLDGGCGAGPICLLATQHGLRVTGLDVSPSFIEAAERRCPEATFVLGNLEHLPFQDESFDGFVACNSFQFLPNPVDGVREAVRVLRPGGGAAIAVFDLPEKCEGAIPIRAIVEMLPAGTHRPNPFGLSGPRSLETIVCEGGLVAESTRIVATTWIYADRDTALRAFFSAGPSQQIRSLGGESKLRDALDAALAQFRKADGSYVLENSFALILARKP